jgi:hypothetical protein
MASEADRRVKRLSSRACRGGLRVAGLATLIVLAKLHVSWL